MMQINKTGEKRIGYLTIKEIVLITGLISFALLSLLILYYTFTPLLGGSTDMWKDYRFITHTISKLGRLENQPLGTWVLWSLAMICFGVSFLLIIQKFNKYMQDINSRETIGFSEKYCQKIGWLCFRIGAIAVIIVGFFPLSSSNGIYTVVPHKIVVSFMAFMVLGWLILFVPMINFTRRIQKALIPFTIQYIFGALLIIASVYWVFETPKGGLNPDDVYLMWGFWSFVLAEWLTLFTLLVYGLTLFWLLVKAKPASVLN